MIDDIETTTFRGGRARLRLEVRDSLIVVLDDRDAGVKQVSLPYPRAGYGGHSLIVSPDERYLALSLYSGQSDAGYEIFQLRPELRHVTGLPYVFGVGYHPVFSPDSKHLALAMAVNNPDPEEDEPGEQVVDWVELRVHTLPRGPIALCQVRVRLPAGAEPTDERYAEQLRFTGSGVAFTAPWGATIEVPLPLPAEIVVTR